MEPIDLEMVRGDDFSERLTFTDSNGNPLDVSGYTFAGQVRADPDSSEVLATIDFDTSQADDGIVDWFIARSDSENFPMPYVYFDIEFIDDDDKKYTAPFGRILLTRDTTRV